MTETEREALAKTLAARDNEREKPLPYGTLWVMQTIWCKSLKLLPSSRRPAMTAATWESDGKTRLKYG